jgi:predicted MFS family arabinose efflux permease
MLIWGSQALSELGSQTSTVAYPLLILALTGSAAKAGVVGLAKWLPFALFALPAGAIADRVNRRRLMIASDAIRLAGVGSIVVALWLGRPPYLQVALVAFLDGTLFITSHICERGALAHVVAPEQVQDAIAQNEARHFGATIGGPPLGGALFAVARSLPFVVDAVSFACSMTALSLTRRDFQAQERPRAFRWHELRKEVVAGFSWLRHQPFFRAASLLFAASNPVFTGLYLLAILLARRHGASSATIGAMFAIVGAGGILGAILAAPLRRRLSARAVIAAEDWLPVAAVLSLLVAHSPFLIVLLVAAAEFATPVTNSFVAGARIAATPHYLQGPVQAASTLAAASLAWVGPPAVGFAFQHAGATGTVLIVAGWSLALAIVASTAPALRHGFRS